MNLTTSFFEPTAHKPFTVQADTQHGLIVRSRNIAMLVAALRNARDEDISAAIIEARGKFAARQIARDVERMAGGGK
jgi:hypothetical protein